MRRRLLVAAASGLVVVALAGTAFLATAPTPPAGAAVIVREGDALAAIGSRLRRGGVIRSALVFRLLARTRGLDRRVQPGLYRFGAPISLTRLLELLTSGGERSEVTVPEGLTVREVAALLARHDLGSAEGFLCLAADPAFLLAVGVPGPHLEGYLFPDTYRFTPTAGPEEVLGTMVRRFHERFGVDRQRRARARGMSVNEVVTLASIVEKETGLAAERPLIAGVFSNRLRLGMPLQSDPTAIYAIADFDGDLTRADLARPSPYNTYVTTGLPPGPIANPGLAAIDAALEPAATPHLYFVSRNDGSHVFSTTLAEHNRAVARHQHPRAGRGTKPDTRRPAR
jgi:UPF0755 protein